MITPETDLYAVLRIAPDASPDQIRYAYRELLRRHHPDSRPTTPGDPARSSDIALQQVLDAYAVLSNPTRRSSYNQRRQHAENPDATNSNPESIRLHTPRAKTEPPIQAGPVRWHP